MKQHFKVSIATCLAVSVAAGAFVLELSAADAKDDAIKEVMKTYHKAPKGVDPVCKKASDGKATPEEINKLVTAYKTLSNSKPPRGDDASWKEKTAKLLSAAEAMQKGDAGAVARFKEAVSCKACHSVHKPE